MNIVLLGPPASGKGTIGLKISKVLNIPTISTGDIIRDNIKNKTALGLYAEKIISDGNLISDEIVIELVNERIKRNDCKKGYILDGFPRNVEQAKIFSKNNKLDLVLLIDIDFDIVLNRITNRRICSICGKTHNILKYKSQFCDCGGKLIRRKDDSIETAKNRLDIYETQTKPLINYYKELDVLSVVDGSKPSDIVYNEAKKIIDMLGENK